MKKKAYITPFCDVVILTEGFNVMLTLSVNEEETTIVGAKEQNGIWGDIDDEEITDPSKTLWGNDDDDSYGY